MKAQRENKEVSRWID